MLKKYYEVLKKVTLFAEINENQFDKIFNCLKIKLKSYKKDETIFMTGDDISSVGIVLQGEVQIFKEDILGNKNILVQLLAGEIFAEVFVCAEIKKIPVTVVSMTDCEILFIDYGKIISPCSVTCDFHEKLIENMLRLIANKNLMLNQKIEIISKRTMREKIIAYLEIQSNKQGSKNFKVNFSRGEMADFLCVDRSAMSREICKMRDSGILKFKGNSFELL